MAISSDGRRLAIRDRSGRITLWDMTVRRQVGELPGHGWHRALAITAPGDLLAAGANDRTEAGIDQGVVRLWDLNTRKEISQLVHPNVLNCLAMSPDGRWLATHGADRLHSSPGFRSRRQRPGRNQQPDRRFRMSALPLARTVVGGDRRRGAESSRPACSALKSSHPLSLNPDPDRNPNLNLALALAPLMNSLIKSKIMSRSKSLGQDAPATAEPPRQG